MTRELEPSHREGLCEAVREAISRSEPIRAIGMDGLKIEASGGTVVLQGAIASEAQRYVAEQLAREVPGVKEVVNQLVTSEHMESLIALALAAGETTRRLRIAVRVVSGVARLYGAVSSPEEADLAAAVARGSAKGIAVQSHLQVVPAGEPVTLLWQCSVEGRRLAASAKAPSASEPAVVEDASHPVSFEAPPPAPVGGTA